MSETDRLTETEYQRRRAVLFNSASSSEGVVLMASVDFDAMYSALDEAHQTAINLEKDSFGNVRALRTRQRGELKAALDLMSNYRKPF